MKTAFAVIMILLLNSSALYAGTLYSNCAEFVGTDNAPTHPNLVELTDRFYYDDSTLTIHSPVWQGTYTQCEPAVTNTVYGTGSQNHTQAFCGTDSKGVPHKIYVVRGVRALTKYLDGADGRISAGLDKTVDLCPEK